MRTPSVIILRLFLLAGYLYSFDVSAAGALPGSVEQAPLKLLMKETPQPAYGVVPPKQITGRVMLHAEGRVGGAAGVSVTDGYSVVRTDVHGNYELKPNAGAVFVYLTRPTGLDIVGDWYQPLAKRVDFELTQAKDDENDFVFVHVTDTHVSRNARSVAGLSRFVREVNGFEPQPRFVVNSGDLLNLSKSLANTPAAGRADFRNYVGIMNHLEMPCYNVAGDHTDSSYRLDEFPRGDHRCGKPLYWEFLGPHFFSFEYGRIHFMSIDYGYHLGRKQRTVNGQVREYPTLEVQPVHLEWMKQDMAARTDKSFIITTSESDLVKYCPGFPELAKEHDIRLQLVGDHHVVSYKSSPVPYRVGGALAGCWWNPKARQLCPDLSPQGYLIYRVQDERLESFYKGLGQRVAVVSHRFGAPWQGGIELQAHLVQPREGEGLEFSLDGETWKPLPEIARPFYRSLHAVQIDTTRLKDGLRELRVRSTSSGEVRTQSVVVANHPDAASQTEDAMLRFTIAPNNGWTTPRAPAGSVEILFNRRSVGRLKRKVAGPVSFRIPADLLRAANTLSFRFADRGDGMSFTSPILAHHGRAIHDPRDTAIREIKVAHWGAAAAKWGGFIAGSAEPPVETPFHRKQNVFCFVLPDEN
ncbi:MAG: metallophosphoesterase N-terminal domain-containing protein [Limisphaerales bacterium]